MNEHKEKAEQHIKAATRFNMVEKASVEAQLYIGDQLARIADHLAHPPQVVEAGAMEVHS